LHKACQWPPSEGVLAARSERAHGVSCLASLALLI
jgi:hypothetical protein